MKDSYRRFAKDESGYVVVLALIMMPLLLGFSLLVMDVGRANNLHTDLQSAADSLALAAGRELDGGADAVDRAEAVIAGMIENQARFSDGGAAIIDETQVETFYLDAIPASDDSPIDADWIDAHAVGSDQAAAAFVMVRTLPRAITSLFPIPVGLTRPTINMRAEAVATYDVSACDITPIFMCNPFELAGGGGKSMEQAFADGDTYSKEFRILKTEGAPGPGNFGLLETEIPLREAFATGKAGACYSRNAVETKPGVTLGHVNTGLNVRFDIYSGSLKSENDNPDYRPASNVRKGAINPNQCNKFESAEDYEDAMGFPPGGSGEASYVSSSTWERDLYWSINHGAATMPNIASSSHPSMLNSPPSRYDVYRYEITNGLVGDKGGKKKETGIPHCYKGPPEDITDDPDRRIIFAAVVNCLEEADKIAGRETLRPDAFVSVFLVAPIEKVAKCPPGVPAEECDESSAAEKPIRLEIVDVTGNSGNGTLNTFLREEATLVR